MPGALKKGAPKSTPLIYDNSLYRDPKIYLNHILKNRNLCRSGILLRRPGYRNRIPRIFLL
ncbi:MAG TPA: hypothetical protein VIH90_06160, partial [Candidatus Saccharimonadales bacterium]